ncbi:helix-turn-helix domain-containing protein [Aerococcus suis]
MSEDLKLYTVEEVADMLKVSRRTVYNYIKSEKLRAYKIGKEWRISKEDVLALIKGQ